MSSSSKTDWAKVDALTDETIDTSDVPPLGDEFLRRAKLRLPRESESITLPVDAEVLAWFRRTGAGWEQRANAALRIYAEAHAHTGAASSTS